MAELDHEAVYRHVFDAIHALEPSWTMIPAGDDGQAFEPGSRPALPFLAIKVSSVDVLGHTWPDEYDAGQLSYRRKVSPSISVQWFGVGGVSALSSLLRRLETPDHADLEVILEHEFEFVRALRRPQNQTLGLEGVFEPRAGMDFSIAIWETWQRSADQIEQVEIVYEFDDHSASFVGG